MSTEQPTVRVVPDHLDFRLIDPSCAMSPLPFTSSFTSTFFCILRAVLPAQDTPLVFFMAMSTTAPSIILIIITMRFLTRESTTSSSSAAAAVPASPSPNRYKICTSPIALAPDPHGDLEESKSRYSPGGRFRNAAGKIVVAKKVAEAFGEKRHRGGRGSPTCFSSID